MNNSSVPHPSVTGSSSIDTTSTSESPGAHGTSTAETDNTRHTNVGAVIVGPIVAVIALALVATFFALLLRRRRRSRRIIDITPFEVPKMDNPPPTRLEPTTLPRSARREKPACRPDLVAISLPANAGAAIGNAGRPGPFTPARAAAVPIQHPEVPPSDSGGDLLGPQPASLTTVNAEIDINRIVELIAQRLDRTASARPAVQDAPPRYDFV